MRTTTSRLVAGIALMVSTALSTAASGAAEPAPTTPPVRLAILAVDGTDESRAVADLLTAKLARGDQVQVVERAELDRILGEQALSAAGLADQDKRMTLGRTLKADGLLFLEHDKLKKRMSARLVETGCGFQASRWYYPLADETAAMLAEKTADDVTRALGKLALNPAQRLLVSVVFVGNATLSPEHFWIEDEVPECLAAYLSQDPRVLVLERRHLDKLLTEAFLTTGAPEFRSAGVLVDGEIALKPGQVVNKQAQALVFTMRLWRADHTELSAVSVDGTLDAMDDLVARGARALRDALVKVGPQRDGLRVEESKMLLNLNRAWATETAYALDVTNAAARQALITKLVGDNLAYNPDPSNPMDPKSWDRTTALQKAKDLLRARDLDRATGYANVIKALGTSHTYGFLSRREVEDDEELRALVRPIRQIVRLKEERFYGNSPDTLQFLAKASSVFFDNEVDRAAYLDSRILKTLNATNTPGPARLHQSLMFLHSGPRPPAFEEAMYRSSDPAIRFCLLTMAFYAAMTEREQLYLAPKALARLDGIAGTVDMLLNDIRARHLAGHWGVGYPVLNDVTRDLETLLKHCPEAKPQVSACISKTLETSLAQGDFSAFLWLPGTAFFPFVEPRDQARLIERVLTLRDQGTPLPDTRMGTSFAELEKQQRALATQFPDLKIKVRPGVATRVLLKANAPALLSRVGDQDAWTAFKNNHSPYPKRMLLDGNTLWVGMSSVAGKGTASKDSVCNVALLQLDLRSGAILSFRKGVPSGPQGSPCPPDSISTPGDLAPLTRWGDWICMAVRGTGVLLFPSEPSTGDTSLRGVKRLAEAEGLPSTAIHAVAGLGDDLYIALKSVVVKWNLKSEAITMVANLESKVANSPLRGRIDVLIPDVDKGCLYAAGEKGFRLDQATAQWQQTHTGIINRQSYVMMPDGRNVVWQRFTGFISASFDPRTGRVRQMRDPELPRFPLPDGCTPDFDFMAYEGGTLVPLGAAPDWSIQYCWPATNALPKILAWTAEALNTPTPAPTRTLRPTTMLELEPVAPDEPEQEVAERRALREMLQSHAHEFPFLEPNTDAAWAHYQTLALNRKPIRNADGYYDAIRFKWPVTGGKFIWSMVVPPKSTLTWWVIPVEGQMRGFENYIARKLTEDVEGVGKKGTLVMFQDLRTAGFVPGKEYILWFGFEHDKPVDLPVSLNVIADDAVTIPHLFERIFGARIETLRIMKL